MTEAYNIIIGVYNRDVTTGLFNLRRASNTREQRYEIFKDRPRLEVREHSYFFQVNDPWSGLPNQVFEALMAEAFERRLDRLCRGHLQLYDFSSKENCSFKFTIIS